MLLGTLLNGIIILDILRDKLMNELTTKEMKFCQADELIKSLHIMNNTELKFMFYALSKREIGETKITTTFDDVVNHLKFEYGGKQTRTYKKAIESIIQKSVMSCILHHS